MRIEQVSDTGPNSLIHEICGEIQPTFRKLESRFAPANFSLFYRFTCLPASSGAKKARRLVKAENALYLDVFVDEDQVRGASRVDQALALGREFIDYTAESLKKYKIPGLDSQAFLAELEAGCQELGWLPRSAPADGSQARKHATKR